MRYAIGEVVLVVIGILIALAINNWNEQRKEREKFDQVLIEVEKELIVNIQSARRTLEFYHYKDSLINIFFFDTLTLEDFKKNREFMSLPYTVNVLKINDEAYQKLLGFSYGLSPRQDSIINNLKQVYSTSKSDIENTDEAMITFVIETNRYKEKFSWFKDYHHGKNTDEIYDFFLNDPMYQNQVVTWGIFGLQNQAPAIEQFELSARSSYRNNHEYLGRKNSQRRDSLMFEYDPNEYSQYLGTYVPEWHSDGSGFDVDSIVVNKEINKLNLTFYQANGIMDKKEITIVNMRYFRTEHGYGFWSNIFDETGSVIGLKLSKGNFMMKSKKIR